MDLFSMGVIDDDDRPRQHKPRPVKCYEEALLPKLPPSTKCVDCRLNKVQREGERCPLCERERSYHAAAKRTARKRKSLGVVERRLHSVGFVVEMAHNADAVAALIGDGRARWATPRDKRRLGLRDDWRAILPSIETRDDG